MAWWPFGKKDAATRPEKEEAEREGGAPTAPAPEPAARAPAPLPPAGSPAGSEPPQAEASAPVPAVESPRGAFARLREGLRKTAAGLRTVFGLRRRIDGALLDELEVKLYEADFGPELVAQVIQEVRAAWVEGRVTDSDQISPFLQKRILERLAARETLLARAPAGPTVILVAGVNGTGKTTSIAKLASYLKGQGATVLLAAGDTFRAAATEQLQIWSERIAVPLVTGSAKGDPAAVAFTACERALREGFDYLIIDTAGRLHTQVNLMRELEKVRRVLSARIEGAPHEVLLVLDATVGQNALSQAEAFNRAIALTGLILAKLDGTAKGGVVVALNNQLKIPVKFVGLGERVEDWAEFSPEKFVAALFD